MWRRDYWNMFNLIKFYFMLGLRHGEILRLWNQIIQDGYVTDLFLFLWRDSNTFPYIMIYFKPFLLRWWRDTALENVATQPERSYYPIAGRCRKQTVSQKTAVKSQFFEWTQKSHKTWLKLAYPTRLNRKHG